MTENAELRKEARERAEMKLSFYINFTLYIIINSLLISIWYFNGMGFPWIIFPLVGWGIGSWDIISWHLFSMDGSYQMEWLRKNMKN